MEYFKAPELFRCQTVSLCETGTPHVPKVLLRKVCTVIFLRTLAPQESQAKNAVSSSAYVQGVQFQVLQSQLEDHPSVLHVGSYSILQQSVKRSVPFRRTAQPSQNADVALAGAVAKTPCPSPLTSPLQLLVISSHCLNLGGFYSSCCWFGVSDVGPMHVVFYGSSWGRSCLAASNSSRKPLTFWVAEWPLVHTGSLGLCPSRGQFLMPAPI